MIEETLGGIKVAARSIGGIGTTISFPHLNITIDLGVCTPQALRTDYIALTHAHADHMGGLQTYLGVRDLLKMKPSQIFAPQESYQIVKAVVDLYGALQGWEFEATVSPAIPHQDIQIGKDLYLRTFKVKHVIPTQGYSIVRKVKKLKQEYIGLPDKEIVSLRSEKEGELFSQEEECLVTVTGDTLLEGLPFEEIRYAKVLFIETTFIDAKKTIEDAHKGSHIHLEELIPILMETNNQEIVFYHFSNSYTQQDIEHEVFSRLPKELAKKVHLLIPETSERL